MRGVPRIIASVLGLCLLWTAPAGAQPTGGMSFERPGQPAARAVEGAPRQVATIGADGRATAPAEAPPEVHAAIEAANRIIGRPYRYGGGHARIEDTGYDCSGTVSYALLGAGVLARPLDSTGFMRWGVRGPGRWITVYAHRGHAFAVIAGLRLDTSAAGDRSRAKGPRWRPVLRSTRGFVARHPKGL
jgi:hypothetical protein